MGFEETKNFWLNKKVITRSGKKAIIVGFGKMVGELRVKMIADNTDVRDFKIQQLIDLERIEDTAPELLDGLKSNLNLLRLLHMHFRKDNINDSWTRMVGQEIEASESIIKKALGE